MRNNLCMGLGLALCVTWAGAQNSLDNPDWVEAKEPPPPAFSADKLVPIDMPTYVTLKVGIDPDTLTVGSDGIVRYVVVMRNSTGSINAAYEGIRCEADQVKTYARQGSSGTWALVENAQWRNLTDNMPSRHAHALARQGACQVQMAPSKDEILQALRKGKR